eukprot:260510-Chlamydomonas_euryale.AAC.1
MQQLRPVPLAGVGAEEACTTLGGKPCGECHGTCCVDDGHCAAATCAANQLSSGVTNECVSSCEDGARYDAGSGRCRGPNGGVMTVVGGGCGLQDPPQPSTVRYFAFCDLSAYGGGAACAGEGVGGHGACLGRVRCRDGASGSVVACAAAIATLEGSDCVMSGTTGSFRACGDATCTATGPWDPNIRACMGTPLVAPPGFPAPPPAPPRPPFPPFPP